MTERPSSDPVPSPMLGCAVSDGSLVLGYLAIDSFIGGRSHGGVRMRQDVSAEEIALLARTMTLKYGFLGLPFGGAKAGVIGDPEAPLDEKRARLIRFGRAIKPLLERQVFVPAGDMGTTLEDIRFMLASVGVPLEKRRLPPVSSGHYTAQSVYACAKEMAEARGLDLAEASVAIQGFGAVGTTLAALMHKAGARVVAISTSRGALHDPQGLDVPALLAGVRRWGSEVVHHAATGKIIPRDELLGLPVEILCPCAGLHAIHEGNVDEVQPRIVSPGANNPWTLEAGAKLESWGVSLMPDFVANSGGVLGTVMAYAGFHRQEIERFIQESFMRSTRYLLGEARRQDRSIRAVAERLFELRRVRPDEEAGTALGADMLAVGIWLHRHGLVPRAIVRAAARPYFRRKMAVGLEG